MSEGRGDCFGVVFEEKEVGGVYGDDVMKFASKRSSGLECDDAVDWLNSVPSDRRGCREGPETSCETVLAATGRVQQTRLPRVQHTHLSVPRHSRRPTRRRRLGRRARIAVSRYRRCRRTAARLGLAGSQEGLRTRLSPFLCRTEQLALPRVVFLRWRKVIRLRWAVQQ